MSNYLDYEINKELGECYLFMGDMDKAESYYKKAAENADEFCDPYLGLATVAVQRGNLESALTLYKKAISIQENDKAYAGAGLVYMEMGQHDDAMKNFEKSLAINSSNAVAMNCFVREAYLNNCVERVIPMLERSLSENPDNEAYRITLAGCLVSTNNTDKAKTLLEGVLADNPENKEAQDLIAHIAA